MPQASRGVAGVQGKSHSHREPGEHLVQCAYDTDRKTEAQSRKDWSQIWGRAWVTAQVSAPMT